MRKLIKNKFAIATLVLLGSVSCGNAQDSVSDVGIKPAVVVSPEIPEQIDIAGDVLLVNRTDIREKLDRELTAFSYMHSFTSALIKRANRYFPEVEPILKEMGVPDDFKYLMAVESNLDPRCVSPMGAAGLWQIMPETARKLGLEVNKEVDERYNTELATRAACQYLLDAYKVYGNWWNVAASYNAGQGYVTSELRKQQQKHVVDAYLYQETSRYFYRIAALKVVMQNPQGYGYMLEAEDLYPPYKYKEVVVDTTITSLTDWAIEHGTTLAFLKEANPWLRTRELPDESRKKYTLRVLTKEFLYTKPTEVPVHDKRWIVE